MQNTMITPAAILLSLLGATGQRRTMRGGMLLNYDDTL